MNISSIVVQTLPENVERVIEIIKENPDICEYHLHDPKGKIIVTVEGKDVEEEIHKLVDIQCFDHVIAADMQMTYQEEQLDNEFEKLKEQDEVPEILRRKDVDPKTVVYGGDLKKRF